MVLLWGEGTLNKPDRVGYISHKRVPLFHLGYTSLEVNFSYVLLFFVGRMIRIQIESYDFVVLLVSSEFNFFYFFLIQ